MASDVGLELEVLALSGKEPLTRQEWLTILEEVKGTYLKDECTQQIVGKVTQWGSIKTDTTSVIIEASLKPGPLNAVISRVHDFIQVVEDSGLKLYPHAYLPHPTLEWYLRNATPRGHYRLLQWYGYDHWRISTMASTQIWLDVSIDDLPCALNSINVSAPLLLEKYANSPCCGWKEYRVKAWELFSKNSWVSIPHGWLPRSYKSWDDVIYDLLSGHPQEAKGCKDLSPNSFREMAIELSEFGTTKARDVTMAVTNVSSFEILEGMQRWSFRPAIVRWKVGRIKDSWLYDLLIEGTTATLIKGIEKTMIEVRFLPTLSPHLIEEAVNDLLTIKENCEELPVFSAQFLEWQHVRAAKGLGVSNALREAVTRVLKR